MSKIEWVILDIGGTVLNDRRVYKARARASGLASWELGALIGGLRALGQERRLEDVIAVPASQIYVPATEADLYPDARQAIDRLGRTGIGVGLAGNQPGGVGVDLRGMGLNVEFVLTSAELGSTKPAAEFFAELVRLTGASPSSVLHVGDQVAADVVGAVRCGLRSLHLVRGPWGLLDAENPQVTDLAVGQVKGLLEIADVIARLNDPTLPGLDV